MQVRRDTGPGDPADVHPDVEALRPGGGRSAVIARLT